MHIPVLLAVYLFVIFTLWPTISLSKRSRFISIFTSSLLPLFPPSLFCFNPSFHVCHTSSSPLLSLSLTLHLSFLSFFFLSHSPSNRQFSSSSTVGHPVLSGPATAPLTRWSTSSPAPDWSLARQTDPHCLCGARHDGEVSERGICCSY